MIGEEERAAVRDVLNGPILVHGPRTAAFEEAFAKWVGAPHAVSCSSCTAAMHLVYFALGIRAGRRSHRSGPNPCGDRARGRIDRRQSRSSSMPNCGPAISILRAIEARITPRTRAISVVHYLGVPVDMTAVNAIAKRHGLFVLEDCALAIGTRVDGVHAGLLGDVGCFSFYPVKHMTTAEGGMIITRDGGAR